MSTKTKPGAAKQTATLNVYLLSYSVVNGQDLHTLTNEELAQGLWITPHEYSDDKHVLVGTAEVAIALMPRAEIVTTQVEALRQQEKQARADFQARLTEIQRQINSLLAIEGAASEVA